MIKKAKNYILSPYALRAFVAGVGLRPLNERERERDRFPDILVPGGASHSFFIESLENRDSCSLWRQLASLPAICIRA